MSFKEEYRFGTDEGAVMLDTPLTGRVVSLTAQCLTPAEICLRFLPVKASISLGVVWFSVELVPNCVREETSRVLYR